jgi:SAM-dependent methyltransferase
MGVCSMARWNRAVAALPFREGKVLDVGCAFGFATLLLARQGYQTVGVDNSPRYIAWAKRRHPQGEYLLCSASALPLTDASFDGVLLLDVLEHVVDQVAVIGEVQRVLKPGGTLILSVPHRGLLSWLDSLNVYARLVRTTHHGLFPQEIAQTGMHRHYSVDQLRILLGPAFTLERVCCTGLGIAELVNLPLLVFCRYFFSWEGLYQILQYVYFLVYLLEDLIPLGRIGYHVMIVVKKQEMPQSTAV